MVAFKEEFPYLRSDSGQLFEFNEKWLHAAITRSWGQAKAGKVRPAADVVSEIKKRR